MSGAEEKMRLSGEIPDRADVSAEPQLPISNADAEKPAPAKSALHPSAYVVIWITLSSSVILFNKWILDTKKFGFPVILTTYHLAFATLMTQLLARYSTALDGRKTVKMTGRVYLRAIVPIGILYSLSLIFGNLTYLYLSVAFIQMLKATTPVAVLFSSWALGVSQPSFRVFLNVSAIVVGVVIASIGEIRFVLVGFLFQLGGIIFEALRLTMVQRLLNSPEYKMDPLVSLYYFAPVCAAMNVVVAMFWELPRVTMADVENVGYLIFLMNGICAFLLNVSVVMLIGKTSSLVLTLCGVLKDVLLVAASMLIWGTPVSGLQFFGYSIALCGMVYYKLGADTMKEYTGEANRKWADLGARRPVLRKLIVGGSVLVIMTIVFSGMAPYASGYDATRVLSDAANKVGIGRGGA